MTFDWNFIKFLTDISDFSFIQDISTLTKTRMRAVHHECIPHLTCIILNVKKNLTDSKNDSEIWKKLHINL